ncbi:MAG TPA: alpha/beta hydrolase [Ktedonobacterales bacterium]|nr:alpha/beta hydrolase [Ktedonobacterales bacterium]
MQPAQPSPTGHYVHANGLRLYYEDTDASGARSESDASEPLVLLHGGTDTSHAWRAVVPLLSARFRVLRPDSRGHGRTDNPAGRLSYPQMAEDVAAFISALGLRRPLVCGWSDGGQTALELALEHPDVVRAVIANGVMATLTESYKAYARGVLCADAAGHVDLERYASEHATAVGRLRALHSHVYGEEYWRDFLPRIAALWLSPTGLTPERLARIRVPLLLSHGDRDEFIALEEPLALYRQIPGAELAVAPHADHSFPARQPEVFAAQVLGFDDRLRQAEQAQSATG